VPEAVDQLVRQDQRVRRRDARQWRFADCETHDPVGVIGGQRVADQQSGVHADHGELLVAERVHQPDEVVGEGARVVALLRLVGEPDAALVDCDDLEVPGQRRHDEAPVVPRPGPAVDQQQWWAVAADDRMQAHLTGVDVAAGERVGESRRQVWCPGDGAGAFRSGSTHRR
jgi:hypothetical protein